MCERVSGAGELAAAGGGYGRRAAERDWDGMGDSYIASMVLIHMIMMLVLLISRAHF